MPTSEGTEEENGGKLQVHQATITEIEEVFHDAVSIRSEHSVYFDPRKFSEVEPPNPALLEGDHRFGPKVKDTTQPWQWPSPVTARANEPGPSKTLNPILRKISSTFVPKLERLESVDYSAGTDTRKASAASSTANDSVDKVNRWLNDDTIVQVDLPDSDNGQETGCVKSLTSKLTSKTVKLTFCIFIVVAISVSVCVVIYIYSKKL